MKNIINRLPLKKVLNKTINPFYFLFGYFILTSFLSQPSYPILGFSLLITEILLLTLGIKNILKTIFFIAVFLIVIFNLPSLVASAGKILVFMFILGIILDILNHIYRDNYNKY